MDNITDQSLSESEDKKDDTKDLDYGLVFGAGYEFSGLVPLIVEAKYHLGLADIAGTSEDFETQDSSYVKTRSLLVMVGVKF